MHCERQAVLIQVGPRFFRETRSNIEVLIIVIIVVAEILFVDKTLIFDDPFPVLVGDFRRYRR